MKRAVSVLIFIVVPSIVHAGAEYAASYNGGIGSQNAEFQFEGGYSYGPGWFSLGVRQHGGLFGSAGLRHRIGPIEGRIGYIYANHESSHEFSSPYPEDTDGSFGSGGIAEISWARDGLFQPFARYQIISVNHEYDAVRQTGTDTNGDPIYGDPVSHSETDRISELVLGIRMSF